MTPFRRLNSEGQAPNFARGPSTHLKRVSVEKGLNKCIKKKMPSPHKAGVLATGISIGTPHEIYRLTE